MDRKTILTPARCELKDLPLDAVEAFLLSQIDGQLTLEEVGEIVGLDFGRTIQLASRLVELGAVSRGAEEKGAPSKNKIRRSESIRPRIDPRAEPSEPPSGQRTEQVSVRLDAHMQRSSLRPSIPREDASEPKPPPKLEPKPAATEASEPRKERRRSSRAIKAVRKPSVRNIPKVDPDACDLDEATLQTVIALDAKLGTVDHYGLLEVGREADKKEIKRAYYAMASKFHPDRFFGKKLGRARVPLERIFIRLTAAHDTLSNKASRAEYDATLPPVAKRPSTRRMSKAAMKAARKSSRAIPAVQPNPPASSPPEPAVRVTPTPAGPAPTAATPTPAPTAAPATPASDPPVTRKSNSKLVQQRALAKQIEADRIVSVFLQAADEALRADDVIGAANNLRLALQNTDDPFIRQRLEAVDGLAKTRRWEQSLTRARAAEKAERWGDAADHYAKANAARKEAATAERAAHALRMAGGDLHRAVAFAEEAVTLEAKNAGHHMTLGEVYLAAKLLARAATESARALELAPDDPRAKALVAAVSLAKKK